MTRQNARRVYFRKMMGFSAVLLSFSYKIFALLFFFLPSYFSSFPSDFCFHRGEEEIFSSIAVQQKFLRSFGVLLNGEKMIYSVHFFRRKVNFWSGRKHKIAGMCDFSILLLPAVLEISFSIKKKSFSTLYFSFKLGFNVVFFLFPSISCFKLILKKKIRFGNSL